MIDGRITKTYNKSPAREISVLIVEDDYRFQRMIKDMLNVFGFSNIELAMNAEEALSIFKQKKIDIVFLDWVMDGKMDGLELLKFIRNDKNSPSNFMPVIFITGKAEKKDVELARDTGVTEFLIKPFTVEKLRDKITSVFCNPREFVLSKNYHGPCRRRKNNGPPDGIERRGS